MQVKVELLPASQAGDLFYCPCQLGWVIAGGCPEAQQWHLGQTKDLVDKLVSPAPVSSLMRGIIQFKRGNGSQTPGFGQHEINVLGRDGAKDLLPGGRTRAGDLDQVGNTDLGQDCQPAINDSIELFKELLFSWSQQACHSREIDPRLEQTAQEPASCEHGGNDRCANECALLVVI